MADLRVLIRWRETRTAQTLRPESAIGCALAHRPDNFTETWLVGCVPQARTRLPMSNSRVRVGCAATHPTPEPMVVWRTGGYAAPTALARWTQSAGLTVGQAPPYAATVQRCTGLCEDCHTLRFSRCPAKIPALFRPPLPCHAFLFSRFCFFCRHRIRPVA